MSVASSRGAVKAVQSNGRHLLSWSIKHGSTSTNIPQASAVDDKDMNGDLKSEPPAYLASTSEDPPAYSPPSSFTINGQSLSVPLVTIQQLKSHLCLLRAFKELRTVVEEGKDERLPENVRALEAPPRWGWFVVER